MNVIGSRPDGWWRDRAAAKRALVEGLQRYAADAGDEVTVVFDGRPIELDGEEDCVHVRFAPHADDAIAALAGQDAEPATLTVVTSDRELAERVRARGARITGASGFRRRLER